MPYIHWCLLYVYRIYELLSTSRKHEIMTPIPTIIFVWVSTYIGKERSQNCISFATQHLNIDTSLYRPWLVGNFPLFEAKKVKDYRFITRALISIAKQFDRFIFMGIFNDCLREFQWHNIFRCEFVCFVVKLLHIQSYNLQHWILISQRSI